jgi:RHS repeat-associated protein
MPAPDLLVGAKNGLGAAASWNHAPLTNPAAPHDAGCDSHGEPFYQAHRGSSGSFGDAMITSSMWAVTRFDQTNGFNGIPNTSNKTCFRYQDAMLNEQGRGFEGFRVIAADEQLAVALGEDPTSAPPGNVCGLGANQPCSPNNRITTTEFYQSFPLTGRVKTVTVTNRVSGAQLNRKSYWWNQSAGPQGSIDVYSPALREEDGETGGVTTTVNEVEPTSGEPARTCTIRKAATPGASLVARDQITLETRSLFNDPSAGVWWLGRVDSDDVLDDFLATPFTLDTACTTSGDGQCTAKPPQCPSVTPSSDAKRTTRNYLYYANGPQAPSRLPGEVTLTTIAGPETQTDYSYDSYGNRAAVAVSARDAAQDSTYPPTTTGLVTVGSTTYRYTQDGYFWSNTNDPLGHVSTQTVDPGRGQVLSSQSVQGGPWTSMVYDELGRLITKGTDGTQPIQFRLSSCSSRLICATKLQSFQAGAPVTTEYRDSLGRAVANGTEGFDGNEILTNTTYNERGFVVYEYPPATLAATPPGAWDVKWGGAIPSPYWTSYSRLDSFGRPGTKTVLRNASQLFPNGGGDSKLVTTYQYSVVDIGVRTDIAVSRASAQGGALNMARVSDRRGQLVETSESVGTPASHDLVTRYFYDPAKNRVAIVDSAENVLAQTYDDLGRRLTIDDPDSGHWTFSWDGLGRLRTQTDARGALVANQFDSIGRLQRRFLQAPGDSAPRLDATWQFDLNGKPGTLGSVLGEDGYRRDYSYDSLLRPWGVRQHLPGPGGTARDLAVEYGFDHNYGRKKAALYPSGESVGLDYDRRGTPIGETPLLSDGTPEPTPYRQVQGMSERGQVTAQVFGNGMTETGSYDPSTGMALSLSASGLQEPLPSGCRSSNPLAARSVSYTYDQFLNVASQTKAFLARDGGGMIACNGGAPQTDTATESYAYDDLQRLLSASRTWTGMTPDPTTDTQDSYAYDDLGNITSKSDYGDTYTYGSMGRGLAFAGPHAVLSVSKAGAVKDTFEYDLNGNLTDGTLSGGEERTITFDELNRPTKIAMKSGYTATFSYAPEGQRYLQVAAATDGTITSEYYFDKLYERVESSPSSLVERTYVAPAVMVTNTNGVHAVAYRHLDRLGSLDAVTDEKAHETPTDGHGYDAFGKPRARDWQSSQDQMQPEATGYSTERGFTGHEHLDPLYLIHMNGRVYDYRLGRFLSVDPIVSTPKSQALNPYSYIGNNPLSGVDPTGFEAEGEGQADTCPPKCDGRGAGKTATMYTGSHIPGNRPIGEGGERMQGMPVGVEHFDTKPTASGLYSSGTSNLSKAGLLDWNGYEGSKPTLSSAPPAETGGADDVAKRSSQEPGGAENETKGNEQTPLTHSGSGGASPADAKAPHSAFDPIGHSIASFAGFQGLLEVGAANVYGQIGAAVVESVVAPLRAADYVLGMGLLAGSPTLQETTAFQLVQRGFNQAYATEAEHAWGYEPKPDEKRPTPEYHTLWGDIKAAGNAITNAIYRSYGVP